MQEVLAAPINHKREDYRGPPVTPEGALDCRRIISSRTNQYLADYFFHIHYGHYIKRPFRHRRRRRLARQGMNVGGALWLAGRTCPAAYSAITAKRRRVTKATVAMAALTMNG